ncbi:hypothetical protein RUND412_007577 [Rhizina undulata]
MSSEEYPVIDLGSETRDYDAWYAEDIKTLPEGIMRLLTEYAGIPEDEVIIPNILKLHAEAIGGFRFLKPSFATSPHYPRILSHLQFSQSAKLLDLGCCFALTSGRQSLTSRPCKLSSAQAPRRSHS